MGNEAEILIWLLAAMSGAALGSFASAASYRLVHGGSIVTGRSRCPSCRVTLGARDLVPLFSYLAACGRCRHCAAKIAGRYPAMEVAMLALTLLPLLLFGVGPLTGVLIALALCLLVLSVADMEAGILPDAAQIWLALLGVGFCLYEAAAGSGRGGPLSAVVAAMVPALAPALFSVMVGGALGLLLHYGYPFIRKKQGLGFGDVKFLAAAGLWISPMSWPFFLFGAGMFGLLFGLVWTKLFKVERFPFGPALAASLYVVVLLEHLGIWHI